MVEGSIRGCLTEVLGARALRSSIPFHSARGARMRHPNGKDLTSQAKPYALDYKELLLRSGYKLRGKEVSV